MSGFTNQFSLQQSILSELIALIKSGRYTSKLGVPNATVLIGHSFGSVLSHGIATTTPDAVDAIILTGYSNNATLLEVPIIISAWQPRMANLARKEWVTLDAGYVTWVDLFSNINTSVLPYFINQHLLSLTFYLLGSSKFQAIHYRRLNTPNTTNSRLALLKHSPLHPPYSPVRRSREQCWL